MEKPHEGLVTLITNGLEQYLIHHGTGEIRQLESGKHYALRFHNGNAYLIPGRWLSDVFDGTGGPSLSSNAGPSMWVRKAKIFRQSLHATEEVPEKLFIKSEDGIARWQSAVAEEHTPLVMAFDTAADSVDLFVYAYRISTAGCFMFWDAAYLSWAMTQRFSSNILKQRVRSWKKSSWLIIPCLRCI